MGEIHLAQCIIQQYFIPDVYIYTVECRLRYDIIIIRIIRWFT